MQLIKSETFNYILNIIIPCILPVLGTSIIAIVDNFRNNNEKTWKYLAGYSSRERFLKIQFKLNIVMLLILPVMSGILLTTLIFLIPSIYNAYMIKYYIMLVNIVLIIFLWKPLKNENREKRWYLK